jgi:DNA polymerase-3 subunit delta'
VTTDEAFEQLRASLAAGRLAHAYVVEGAPRAEGRELAERVLGLLLCAGPGRPCGRCRHCEQVRKHTHPDALWIEPQSKSRKIVIQQVREEILPRMNFTAFAGGWKACVLVGAERLTPEAANAFLKTLEEPPGQSIFLLLTENPQFLLPTIRSRCQYVAVAGADGPARDAWTDRLLAVLAGGGIRRGGVLAALSRSGRIARILKEMKAAAEAEEKAKAEAETREEAEETLDARVNARYRELRAALLRTMLWWYRDVLLLVCGGAEERLYHRASAAVLRQRAQGASCRLALRDVETVETMNRQMERNLPEGLVLDLGLSRLG